MSDQHRILALDTRYSGYGELRESVERTMDRYAQEGFKLKFVVEAEGVIVFTMVKETPETYAMQGAKG